MSSSPPREARPARNDLNRAAPQRSGGTGRPSPFAIAFTVAVLAFVAVRLGPSLLGARVFAGPDMFYLFPLWSHLPDAVHPVTTSTLVTDQIDANFPAMNEVHERLLDGDVALWSSMVGGGVALLSTINLGMISPTRFVFFLLPTWLAPAWSKLFEMGFAAVFTYLLVRRLGGSRAAGSVAGFIYPLTGFMIGWTNWTQTAVAAVIPMLFWAVERFLQERRARDLLPVAVATALLIFGGSPAVAGQALYLGAGYGLVRAVALRGRAEVIPRLARDVGMLAGAVLLGVALTAVQLFPFVVQTLGDVDRSYREGGFYEQVPLHYMLTTVFPGSFAGNDLDPPSSPMDLNAYVGGVVAILAPLGLLQARHLARARSAVVYFVAVLALVVGLVWFQGPWSDWLGGLPVFSGNPIGRIRSQIGLPAAVLAALGIDWIARGGVKGPVVGRSAAESLLGVAIAAAVTALACAAGVRLLQGGIIGAAADVAADVAFTVIPMVVVTALLATQAWRIDIRRMTLVAAAVAVVIQALPATAFYWPTSERSEFYRASEGIEMLQAELGHDRIATLGHAIRPNATQYFRLRTLNGHLFPPSALAEVFQAIDPELFIGPTYSTFSPDIERVAKSPGLDRFGVRYLVAQADSVFHGMPGFPIPIPGRSDPLAPAAETAELTESGIYVVAVPAGDLRGVHIPLEVLETTTLTVELRNGDGRLVAENTRRVSPTAGSQEVPVALALPEGTADGTPAATVWTVSVTSRGGAAVGTFDDQGALRVAAVRDFPAGVPEDDGLSVAFAGEGMIIWERDGYLPRIRWAQDFRVIADPEARVAAVTTSPALRSRVILEEAPEDLAGRPTAGDREAGAEIEVLEDSGDVIRVRTRSPAPGYLVVADSIQRDFAGSVDGLAADILPAEHAGGAVLVPAGSHVVEIRYASPEQRVGSVVTALALGGLVLLLLIPPLIARTRRQLSPNGGD